MPSTDYFVEMDSRKNELSSAVFLSFILLNSFHITQSRCHKCTNEAELVDEHTHTHEETKTEFQVMTTYLIFAFG